MLTEIPADYKLPLFEWLRGLSLEGLSMNDSLNFHVELDGVPILVAPEAPSENGDELVCWLNPLNRQV